MLDLFGKDHPEPAGKAAPAVQLGLVEHAAERAALRSGRPVSQERSEIVAPNRAPRLTQAALLLQGACSLLPSVVCLAVNSIRLDRRRLQQTERKTMYVGNVPITPEARIPRLYESISRYRTSGTAEGSYRAALCRAQLNGLLRDYPHLRRSDDQEAHNA